MESGECKTTSQERFTLIGIIVVFLILDLLATLIVQSMLGATDKAKRSKAMADIAVLKLR
jgi:type II secretory pathway pseudopilin PulG